MLTEYPAVVDEFKTVRKLLEGYSIGRIGDGEVKLINGGQAMREPPNATLGRELADVISGRVKRCLPGVLTMDPAGPKYPGLSRHISRFLPHMTPGVTYYSALITRPDCAPWINCLKYARLVEQLWIGKRVTVVCEEKDNKIFRLIYGYGRCRPLQHIACPHREAYAHIDRLVAQVVATAPDIAIMAAGPTATCMALRLTNLGIQAIDIGSAGGFLLALIQGEEGRR